MTYALREAREYAAQSLPAQTARQVAQEALIALGFRGYSFHDPFHATDAGRLATVSLQAEPVRDGRPRTVRVLPCRKPLRNFSILETGVRGVRFAWARAR